MLEDNHADILGKACVGLGISPGRFPNAFFLPPVEPALREAAEALGLGSRALADIAYGRYAPEAGPEPDGLAMFSTPFSDIVVNSFLVWDAASGVAAAFDTGTDCDGLLQRVRDLGLRLESVFITHTHGDHVYDLDRLVEKSGAQAWTGEPIAGAETFDPGRRFMIGTLEVSTRLTSGHSPRAITYVVEGLDRRLALVGDALFAGSMGGPKISYADGLRSLREQILSLPGDTLLCPGHGPLTTVALEIAHNPFFAPSSPV
jgi:hydroxyacylglutathione hydrolase